MTFYDLPQYLLYSFLGANSILFGWCRPILRTHPERLCILFSIRGQGWWSPALAFQHSSPYRPFRRPFWWGSRHTHCCDLPSGDSACAYSLWCTPERYRPPYPPETWRAHILAHQQRASPLSVPGRGIPKSAWYADNAPLTWVQFEWRGCPIHERHQSKKIGCPCQLGR